MGQYYKIVNLDKKEFLHPHSFGDGLKLLEFGASGGGTMMGLAILLSDGNGRGGGDLDSEKPLVGSWAGDRIVITGDYADENHFTSKNDKGKDGKRINLYAVAENSFKDISYDVISVLCDDYYIREDFAKSLVRYGEGQFGMGHNMPKILKNKIMKGFTVIPDPERNGFFTITRK